MKLPTSFRFIPIKSFFLLFTLLFLIPAQIKAQDTLSTEAVLRSVADYIVNNSTFRFVEEETGNLYRTPQSAPTEAKLKIDSPFNKWHYWNGVLNIGMIRSGEILKEQAYIDFAIKNVAFSFDHYSYFKDRYQGENKWNYPFGQAFITEELDDCGAMGASVIEVHLRDPQTRYRQYINEAANHIKTRQSRLDDGTLVRHFPHKMTLWGDDLYMSIALIARMADLHDERQKSEYLDDAVKQVINYHHYLFNENMGLMHHCWYSDVEETNVAFWGRVNGWALLAHVELLDRLPQDHPQRALLISLLQRHILGIARYQGSNGLWHQLLDKVDSYEETSCSAIFTYVIARAVNKNYIDPRYASIARNGWEGIKTRVRPDGQVEGVCAGTGVADDLVHYYHRPTPLNDIHGIGFVLLAGTEVMQMSQ
ncbi:glycoside hydrolase family 88 protein [candidate division KSB1 bacterium]|nr:glycoside hydrolase family 88 protein [candidate division KSB1 bacterium]